MADVARAQWSSALHGYGAPFFVFFLPTEPWRLGDLTWAILNWQRSTKRGTRRRNVELDSGGGGSWFHRLDSAGNRQNGAAALVEDRRGIGSEQAAPQRHGNDGER
jgi:hypothetical protein